MYTNTTYHRFVVFRYFVVTENNFDAHVVSGIELGGYSQPRSAQYPNKSGSSGRDSGDSVFLCIRNIIWCLEKSVKILILSKSRLG